jgi:hypothetical protein
MEATFTMGLLHHRFDREPMRHILRELAQLSRRWSYCPIAVPAFCTGPVARRFSSQISMISTKELEAELSQTPLVIRASGRLILERFRSARPGLGMPGLVGLHSSWRCEQGLKQGRPAAIKTDAVMNQETIGQGMGKFAARQLRHDRGPSF